MKLRSLLASALLLSHLTASAVTITIDAELLKDQFGGAMAQTGVVVLTAGTDGTFSGPSGNNFVTGTEMFLASWDLSAWGTDGVFTGVADLPFSGDWGTSDPLRIYWYPTLTLSDTGPSAGIPFGTYTDAMGLDGSAPWITPGESDNVSLGFFTSDATFLRDGTAPFPDGGSNLPSAGRAGGFVPPVSGAGVPDSGGTLLMLGAGLTGLTVIRRKLRAA